jgi:DnaK suppressor protein
MTHLEQQCRMKLLTERVAWLARLQAVQEAQSEGPWCDAYRLTPQQVQTKLRTIMSALGRIRDGSYGTCRMCREPVEAERLLALPDTELCSACQRRLEAKVLHRPRGALVPAARCG